MTESSINKDSAFSENFFERLKKDFDLRRQLKRKKAILGYLPDGERSALIRTENFIREQLELRRIHTETQKIET